MERSILASQYLIEVLGENDQLPALEGVKVSGTVEVPAFGCAFYLV